jgi:linker between RRM2 and RRM3 domains in RBM39 protein
LQQTPRRQLRPLLLVLHRTASQTMRVRGLHSLWASSVPSNFTARACHTCCLSDSYFDIHLATARTFQDLPERGQLAERGTFAAADDGGGMRLTASSRAQLMSRLAGAATAAPAAAGAPGQALPGPPPGFVLPGAPGQPPVATAPSAPPLNPLSYVQVGQLPGCCVRKHRTASATAQAPWRLFHSRRCTTWWCLLSCLSSTAGVV